MNWQGLESTTYHTRGEHTTTCIKPPMQFVTYWRGTTIKNHSWKILIMKLNVDIKLQYNFRWNRLRNEESIGCSFTYSKGHYSTLSVNCTFFLWFQRLIFSVSTNCLCYWNIVSQFDTHYDVTKKHNNSRYEGLHIYNCCYSIWGTSLVQATLIIKHIKDWTCIVCLTDGCYLI